jgi:mannose/fructose-specific phosphotransferase system component IIA
MIGIVLVTHGRLADEFQAALEHVSKPSPSQPRTTPTYAEATLWKPSSAPTAARVWSY